MTSDEEDTSLLGLANMMELFLKSVIYEESGSKPKSLEDCLRQSNAVYEKHWQSHTPPVMDELNITAPLKEMPSLGETTELVLFLKHLTLVIEHVRIRLSEELASAKAAGKELIMPVKLQNQINVALEVLVGLGVSNLLEPGVGLPLSRRISHDSLLALSSEDNFMIRDMRGLAVLTKVIGLYRYVVFFGRLLCSEVLQPIVLAKCLPDLLAMFMQLVFHENYRDGMMSAFSGVWENTKRLFADLRSKAVKPSLVYELLVLQTAKGANHVSPAWLKTGVGKTLSEILKAPSGFGHVIAGFCQFVGVDDIGALEWKHCDVVAQVVARTPLGTTTAAYYKLIWDQLKECINLGNPDAAKWARLVSACIRMAFRIQRKLVKQYLLEDVFAPLMQIQKALDNDGQGIELPSEDDINNCLWSLYVIYCAAPLDDEKLLKRLKKVSLYLMQMFASVRHSVCYPLAWLKRLIAVCFRYSDASFRIEALKKVGVNRWDGLVSSGIRPLYCGVYFKVGPNNGILLELKRDLSVDDVDLVEKFKENVKVIKDILELLDSETLDNALTGLISCSVCDIMEISSRPDSSNKRKSSKTPSPSTVERISSDLRDVEDSVEDLMDSISSLIFAESVIHELGDLLEKVRNPEELFTICRVFCKLFAKCIADNASNPNYVIPEDSICLLFGLIEVILSDSVLKKDVDKATLTAWTDDMKTSLDGLLKWQKWSPLTQQLGDQLIQDLNGLLANRSKSGSPRSQSIASPDVSYDVCMKDLGNPILPLRTKAIKDLALLIERKDATALSRRKDIVAALMESLDEEDSFVYLAAINALAKLGDADPRAVIQVLFDQFFKSPNGSASFDALQGDAKIELHLKLGETLVKVSQRLGELTPLYGNQVIQVFLKLFLKCSEPELKASCLSNVGEICSLMRFKLLSCADELLYCVTQTLRLEKAEIVRRAAVHVLHVTLKGCETRLLEIFGDKLREIYRLLKQLYSEDRDHTVRLHAQLALEVLNENMKDLLKDELSLKMSAIRID